MSKKIIAVSLTVTAMVVFTLFSVINAFALEFGSSGSGLSSAIKLCKTARKSYRRDIKDTRAKGLSLHLTKQEISDMLRQIRTYRNRICKEARKEKKQKKQSSAIIKVTSTSFENDAAIPLQYAFTEVSGGQNISPQLSWRVYNPNVKSFALVMSDPSADNWVHWCVTNIPADVMSLDEGASASAAMSGNEWSNGYTLGYEGPYPPPEDDAHIYKFEIFGLNTVDVTPADVSARCTYNSFKAAIADKIVARGTMEGTFDR